MENTYVAGVGMTPFVKSSELTVSALARWAAADACADAGIELGDVELVFYGNATEGLMTGQEMIRGQATFQGTAAAGIPVVNVENACASSSTAVHLAVMAVQSGQADVVLALGAEKMSHPDKGRAMRALGSAVNLERLSSLRADLYGDGEPGTGSLFMDIYADMAKKYMAQAQVTERDFAEVVVKSHRYASLNPRAQYRELVTVDEVLSSRLISSPLRLLMCSPVGDGAAAVVVCSARAARRLGRAQVRILASTLVSGRADAEKSTAVERAAELAYERAGVGPEDLSVVEVHDAAAPAELMMYEELGLCARGDGAGMLARGETVLGGPRPVNTSGGLISKGHPVGATGCAQLVELTEQLRGTADGRQVEGARVGLAENAGGYLGPDPAAVCVTILGR